MYNVICSQPLCPHQETEERIPTLEKKLAELQAEGKPVGAILKQLIQALCAEEVGFILMSRETPKMSSLTPVCSPLSSVVLVPVQNLQRALELKQQHEEEMAVGSYVTLMNLCCQRDNVEEALNLKREM